MLGAVDIHSADLHSVLDNLVSGLVILVLGVMGGAVRRYTRTVGARLEKVAADVMATNQATRDAVGTELEHTRSSVATLCAAMADLGERTAHMEGVLGIVPGHPSGNSRP